MVMALARDSRIRLRSTVCVATHRTADLPSPVEWHEAAHPLPDERSVAAAARALEIAGAVRPDETLWLLLSGGASSLLAMPAADITLEDKRITIGLMMAGGADIHALNTIRKHLSRVKGGQLAAACAGSTLTLAVSDVMDDDLSVIGSGPGVADRSTWRDAAEALRAFGGPAPPARVRRRVEAGMRGEIADTPRPHDTRLERAAGRVIASRRDLLDGARAAAEALGYRVVVRTDPVTGEARTAAAPWMSVAAAQARDAPAPFCFVSAGETTVIVRGSGRGGRNQEFALALASHLADEPNALLAASVGSDGIDGPTDAAGALVTNDSLARARAAGVGDYRRCLDENDSYRFFDALGDLIRTGRTDTNVGDLQILLRP